MSDPITFLAASGTVGTLALLFFLALFIGLVLWLSLSKSDRWKRDADIPLHDEPVDPRHSESTHER
jgi:uncharacterized membrane-anchored protein